MNQGETRSPIKEAPLPTPGQSLERQREREIQEKTGLWIFLAAFMSVLAALEWVRSWMRLPPIPVAMTITAVVMVTLSLVMIRRKLPFIRNLSRGLEGEKAVGQSLEELRAKGFRVFHDIQGNGFNVDHVLVGRQGVFVIETKTRGKARNCGNVKYDGERVLLNGRAMDRDPVAQVKALADFVRSLIPSDLARKVPVRPVVLFPGWFVEPQKKDRSFWLLNPKALPDFLKQEDLVLDPPDVTRISDEFARHARARPPG